MSPLEAASVPGSSCSALETPSYLELTVSIVLLLGIMISYLPQHYRIISRGTSEGISPYFVLLGTTSATAGFANILTVGPSRTAIGCCKELESFQCAVGLLGVVQLGAQWLCYSLILILFLIFFRGKDPEDSLHEFQAETSGWRTAVTVGLVCIFHGLVVVSLTALFYLAWPRRLDSWANILGVMGALLAAVQYLPQIWTTYHLKHVGSLSIPMMFIQTPGGLVFAASLYARLGVEGWSTWLIYLLASAMQGTVLAMAIYYEIQNRNQRAQANGHSEVDTEPYVDSHYTSSHRRPQASRTYSEGLERGLPGPFTGHPELYAETEEDLDDIEEREERAVARENQPLLKPGGIGNPRRSYNSHRH
ncbi:CTNS protein [Geosmithia morbida]|uniref:CTNS protein n=1 Tax=Geosmithia morbida TaxID=1094350 RepID=A0A9P4Z0L5_9HYPO|nr:CTNS protein [Geosmithia morbida]KAF4126503.1 CTNS protein [Geosmithia morbida]